MFTLKIDDEIKPERSPGEPDFDHPNGSKWIVAVDIDGNVTVLDTPNLCDGLIERDTPFGIIGFPCDSESNPGVYEWTCAYVQSIDLETGTVDDFDFEVTDEKLLWEPKS